MTSTLMSCCLDRAGIPDLSDLEPFELDPEAIAGVSFHVAVDKADPERPAYYPFAALDLSDELRFVPLPRETDAASAADAIALLRAAFPAVNAGITGNDSISSIASNTGNAGNAGNTGNDSVTGYAGITGF